MATPRKQRKTPGSPPPLRRPPSRLDYRSPLDGAWYGVRVGLQEGALLRVMHEEFREEMDKWYDPAADFASPDDMAALRARFRPASTILEDARCRDLRAGALLCVLPGGDLLDYDAVLDFVMPAAHSTVDGEERCACRFAVRWAEGPRAGGVAEVGVEKICHVETSPAQDPVLDEFLDGVTEWLGNGERDAKVGPATGHVSAKGGEGGTSPSTGQADRK